jgi:hypothetical protein
MPSLATNQSKHKRDHEQQEKNKEQDFGNLNCANRNASEAEQCSDQGDHEKYNSIVEHFLSFQEMAVQPAIVTLGARSSFT